MQHMQRLGAGFFSEKNFDFWRFRDNTVFRAPKKASKYRSGVVLCRYRSNIFASENTTSQTMKRLPAGSEQYRYDPDNTDSVAQLLKKELSFNRTSLALLGLLLVTLFSIMFIRWDLYIEYYRLVGIDWLLWGIFVVMGITLMAGANLKKDSFIIISAALFGLGIEAWGTQTEIWRYYTEFPPYYEYSRPPWWIIPAWPVSCLAINRMYIFVDILLKNVGSKFITWLYWPLLVGFNFFMFRFYQHTLHLYLTWGVMILLAYVTIKTNDKRRAVLLFLVASALGFFLEYWGTSRFCWIYYTRETPPPVTVFAHGMASVGIARLAFRLQNHWPRRLKFSTGS